MFAFIRANSSYRGGPPFLTAPATAAGYMDPYPHRFTLCEISLIRIQMAKTPKICLISANLNLEREKHFFITFKIFFSK